MTKPYSASKFTFEYDGTTIPIGVTKGISGGEVKNKVLKLRTSGGKAQQFETRFRGNKSELSDISITVGMEHAKPFIDRFFLGAQQTRLTGSIVSYGNGNVPVFARKLSGLAIKSLSFDSLSNEKPDASPMVLQVGLVANSSVLEDVQGKAYQPKESDGKIPWPKDNVKISLKSIGEKIKIRSVDGIKVDIPFHETRVGTSAFPTWHPGAIINFPETLTFSILEGDEAAFVKLMNDDNNQGAGATGGIKVLDQGGNLLLTFGLFGTRVINVYPKTKKDAEGQEIATSTVEVGLSHFTVEYPDTIKK